MIKKGGNKMLSKAKALYQVKLILDYLPEEEYKLIPKETIDYIEENFEYDENLSIDPHTPLEKQRIDDKAYEVLDKIIKSIETTEKDKRKQEAQELNYDERNEIIRLNNLVEMLKKENSKIPEIKDLLSEYKDALKQKDNEIKRLKKNNQDLYNCIQGLPKIVKKLFIKDLNIKLLNS